MCGCMYVGGCSTCQLVAGWKCAKRPWELRHIERTAAPASRSWLANRFCGPPDRRHKTHLYPSKGVA